MTRERGSGDAKARPCGLYRTGFALPSHPEAVASGKLVFFHNHSEKGPPIVLLPEANEANRWRFARSGHLVYDGDFIDALAPLAREGLYRVRRHFHPDDSRIVAQNALVQLGYDRSARPILFFPRPIDGENGIVFPTRGMKIPPSVYELLEPLDLRGPYQPTRIH